MKSLKDFLPKSKWTYFFFAAIVIMFLALAVYVYSKNLKGKLNPSYVENREFIEKDEGSNEAQVVFFTVDWCPYCKKALPIWKEFCEKYDNKNINGHTVSCETFNCTDEKDNLVKRTMDKYKIEGFPTIKMIINDEVYDYEAKPTMEHLEEWINVTLK